MALLNVKEVSELLQVKPGTIYLWVAEGKLPALKLQRCIRFRREDIDAWLAECQIAQREPARLAVQHPRSRDDVDTLIARAKADAYNSCRETRQDRAKP